MNIRKVASLGLAIALQVMPLTRVFIATSPAAGSSFAIVSTWIAGALALMGAVDAVSGASSISISPATATTGVPYSGLVQYSGSHASSARSWELRNNWTGAKSGCNSIYEIAPGLWLTNASTYLARIGGTPTTSGTFTFTMRIWSGSGCSGGDNDTRSATITVSGGAATAPTITTQPASQTVTAGANVTFTVGANGTAPLSYQWRLNGANLSGANSTTLNLTSVTTNQAGSYTCVVSNSVGSATSSAATLTVNPVVAPSITTQPSSQTVAAGANTSFTVAASGTAPLSFQWRLNGANISGASSATLSLTGVTTNQAGSYTCVVTNSAGSATSAAATLTVNIPPTITTQPSSQTVTAGANASFSVAASGTAPFSYQWRLNGANISGATSATLNLTSVATNQAGSYTCVVTNVAGSATSTAATLTVNPAPVAPSIVTQPSSQTVIAGANVTFTVAANGTTPLSYQWRLEGANIAGATGATLNLTGVSTNQAGSYTCVVTNMAGSATSAAATLTVNTPPSITTQPASQSVTAGANLSFTVAASGTTPMSYQWRLNGANISGATSATLNLTSVTTNQAGNYTCVVTNVAGSATSATAVLAVTALPVAPTITTQPISRTVAVGANVSFSVVVSGTSPFSYQWQLNGGDISGATSATLSLTSVGTNHAGNYTCVVSNSVGAAASSPATLTVNVPPTITTQPVSQSVTAGSNVTFTVAATGTGPLSYQWRLNGTSISGATSATLNLTGVTSGQAGSYTCLVSNTVGSATSSAATLTVNVPPTITTQPVSQAVTAGANVTLSVVATGTAPLTYQWQRDGVNVSGGTAASLALTGVTTNQAGSYLCIVTNLAGMATSVAATLSVSPAPIAPTITTQPVSQIVTAGSNVTFIVVVAGTSPFSYQWRLNGVNISGATSATLNRTGVTSGQAGSYTCLVTNIAGSVTSSAATLTVNVPPSITTQPVNQSVSAGANVTLSVVASGTGPLAYQWQQNGANVAGGTGASLVLTSVTTNQAGSYVCIVTNVAGVATSGTATLNVNLAPVAPSITTQPVSQTVTAGANLSFIVVAGGTSPMGYQWRRNGTSISGATSPTLNLSTVTTNQSGTYTCVVTNAAGTATSSGAVLTVQPVVPQGSTLTVVIQGQGTVSPNLNGNSLMIGQSYTMTATPATGYEFAGWSGNIPGSPSSAAALSFVMTSNLVLQATFIASPYTAAAGTYNGLFFESDEVRVNSAGAFNLRAELNGNYSGWLQIGYARYSFSGKLSVDLSATNVITRWNGTPMNLSIRLGQGSEAGQIAGDVSDGVWSSSLAGGRTTTNSLFAGDYTVVIPGVTGSAQIPAGDSYATLHVAADGLATMNGTLADGSQFMQSAYITEQGDWPMYVSLYAAKGAVVSWIHFADLSNSDLRGTLVWIKEAGASATSYPNGFINETEAVGSRYAAPTGQGKAINLSAAAVNFSGGTIASAFNNAVSVNAGSQVVNLSPNAMTLTISTASGAFTGQVTEPGVGTVRKFGGVVLQKQNAGFGCTSGTATSSRVIFAAP